MTDICTMIQAENTTNCNATCNFCPVGFKDFNRPTGAMKQELFEKIVREGMEMGVRHFLPFANGEALTDKRFFSWLDHLKERELTTTLFTNGSLLTKAKADQLATYTNLDSITFSFHGGNPETYKRVMGLNFDKTRANIEYFLSLNCPTPTRVYLLDYEDTTSSVGDFKALWGDKAFVSQAFFNWGGMVESESSKALRQPPLPCQRLLHHMVVLSSGDLALCCMDSDGLVSAGNANDEHLSVLWERNQHLRERHKARDFDMPLCKDCSLNRYGV